MEGTIAVIHTRAEKIGEHVVLIGGTDEGLNGHPHHFGIIGSENVAEIPRGYADIDLLALLNGALPAQIAVGGDVIDDLRQHTAPVDGVGRGQEIAPFRQLLGQLLVGKQLLDPGLGVVEVAHHGTHTHVAALLGDHLQLLNVRHAVLGIEHQDLSLAHILEALQGSLSGVARGGHQNAHRLLLIVLPQRGGEEMGQHLQGHILEGAGGAVPQLQAVGVVVQTAHRSHLGVRELSTAVGRPGISRQLRAGEALQKPVQHIHRPLLVGHILQGLQGISRQAGQHLGSHQTSVRRQSLGNGLSRSHTQIVVSRAQIIHDCLTTLIKLL